MARNLRAIDQQVEREYVAKASEGLCWHYETDERIKRGPFFIEGAESPWDTHL